MIYPIQKLLNLILHKFPFKNMQAIKIHDKDFVPFITAEQLNERIRILARQMVTDLQYENPFFLSVLNGSFFFAADLLREMNLMSEISFVKLSSYNGMESTGTVKTLIGLNEKLQGRNVVVLEDIVDTGRTMVDIFQGLQKLDVKSMRLATLLFKEEALQVDIKPDYVGFSIPDKFVVGYGLDYDQLGRHLKDIYIINETINKR
jgi:hypoxanthine phosphoribosyltransferase